MNQAPMFWQRIIAIPFGLTILATPAWAAKFSATSSGRAADAFFSSVDESGCVHTDVALFASEATAVVHFTPGGPVSSFGSSSEISLSKHDVCTGDVLVGANCSVDLSPSDFQVAPQLSSATLDTTFECFDFVRNRTFDVALDVTWTSFGEITRQHLNTWLDSVNGRIHTKFKGLFRFAAVSGTVSDGVTNFIADADSTATIREDENAEVIFD